MLTRTSVVNHIRLNIASFSSTLEFGDISFYQAFSRALAVQREKKIFFGGEGSFDQYPIFSEPIPIPPITESINIMYHQIKPVIKVKNLDITAVSASSLLQVGSTRHIYAETRIKHIRQLENHSEELNNQTIIPLEEIHSSPGTAIVNGR
ncbi:MULTISPECIES: spore germination protein GerPE [Bacillaceae]|uniref:spore germination protein GerPE n=1 Tax=Bacillaceae TaxID=186817 RepID=UPI001E40ED79|nr:MULTISPECIES: spore germination protein GerPE [Bacillaceae]MCE4050405.1 spore germination protein GerPE [Bacillus sp. Au-Bac7]MCM3030425.1 spore germination protein GerPE [Niallia sp. MER 6]MDL0434651.1 spore germination protein GerPE [Niallia sp. SS-2023]UPO88388.1 spore germination protein GerPE [Niallia sp. Man26]